VGTSNTFHESEMALGSEPTDQYAQKVLDDADIVREAILHRLCRTAVLQHVRFGKTPPHEVFQRPNHLPSAASGHVRPFATLESSSGIEGTWQMHSDGCKY
jgi:hypothetical protein